MKLLTTLTPGAKTMNNVSPINKANRLTEKEVHDAADELKECGTKISSIEVYKYLGRGSLTTITNFLKTWSQEETPTATLPALISLPDALIKSTEQLIIKVWGESQALAEKEINSQREALRQAEAIAAEKIAEAEAFSEVQAKEIEVLEAQIEKIHKDWDADHAEMLTGIKEEQAARHQAYTEKAVCEQKLQELERKFDYVNSALITQQEANQALTTANAELKTKLEATEKMFLTAENQVKSSGEKYSKLEAENKKVEIKNEVQRNQIDQLIIDLKDQKELVATADTENKILREKAAKLEGELLAWKSIKPEEKPAATKSQKGKPFKQTEWTDEQ